MAADNLSLFWNAFEIQKDKELIALAVNGKEYSWSEIKKEVDKNSPLSKKLLMELNINGLI